MLLNDSLLSTSFNVKSSLVFHSSPIRIDNELNGLLSECNIIVPFFSLEYGRPNEKKNAIIHWIIFLIHHSFVAEWKAVLSLNLYGVYGMSINTFCANNYSRDCPLSSVFSILVFLWYEKVSDVFKRKKRLTWKNAEFLWHFIIPPCGCWTSSPFFFHERKIWRILSALFIKSRFHLLEFNANIYSIPPTLLSFNFTWLQDYWKKKKILSLSTSKLSSMAHVVHLITLIHSQFTFKYQQNSWNSQRWLRNFVVQTQRCNSLSIQFHHSASSGNFFFLLYLWLSW